MRQYECKKTQLEKLMTGASELKRTKKISPQMLSIFEECEIVKQNGDIKSIGDVTVSDLHDLWDHISSDDDLKIENHDEFIEMSFICAEDASDLIDSLKFLEYAVSTISDDFESAYLIEGINLILENVKLGVNLPPEVKEKTFKQFTQDEDSWFNPVCGVVMVLTWDLPIDSIDKCVLRYSKSRTDSLYEEDPWGSDSENNDYSHWMPLLVIAVINSSCSKQILKIVNDTCRTSSAMPFWMILCAILKYSLAAHQTEEIDSEIADWFPESYWKEAIFDPMKNSLIGRQESIESLVGLYIDESENWVWTDTYFVTHNQVNSYLIEITNE
jgi:hypothetical protein